MKEPLWLQLAPIWGALIGAALGIALGGLSSPLVLVLGFVGMLLGSKNAGGGS
jgi:hypothetical protein